MDDLVLRRRLEGATRASIDSFMPWQSDMKIVEKSQSIKFRGSGIPHCPIFWAYATLFDKSRVDERGFMLEYTAEQGKVVHALMQKWLGIAGIMFGRWKCLKCKTIYPKDPKVKGVLGPIVCCDSPAEYEEYDMDEKDLENFTGHCDGVLKVCGKYAPLEMKVRNTKEVESIKKSGIAIYKNVLQATSYRFNLPKVLSPTIHASLWHDFVAMVYMDRADIRNKAIVFAPYDASIFTKEVLAVRNTRKCVREKTLHLLNPYCKTSQDNPFCDLHDLCFSKDPIQALSTILPGYEKRKEMRK